jgi:hypothetical protein
VMINDYRDCRSRFNLNAYMVAVQIRFDLANSGFVFPANFNSYIRQQRLCIIETFRLRLLIQACLKVLMSAQKQL